LNLKPRSKPDGAGEDRPTSIREEDEEPKQRKDPFGAARPAAREQGARDNEDTPRTDDAGSEESDGWETAKKPGTKPLTKPLNRREDEASSGKFVPSAKKKQLEAERPRPATEKKSNISSSASGYKPPQQRKAEEEKAKKEADRQELERAKAEAEEKRAADEKRRKEEQKQAAREQREAEAKQKREELLASRPKKAVHKEVFEVDEGKLSAWSEMLEASVSDASANVQSLVSKVTSALGAQELETIMPMSGLLTPLIRSCHHKSDEEVVEKVKRYAPVMNKLIEESSAHRFKVKVLCEAQRIANDMGLPRLSPASALLEVFFDGLYQAEVIEEAYFEMWANSESEYVLDTPGRINAMFQLRSFLDWLRNPEDMNKDDDDDDDEDGEEEDNEEEEEEELSDIEANVPKRNKVTRPRP